MQNTLSEEMLARVGHLLPRQRGNVRIPHGVVLAAILYVEDSGCSWRSLPACFGNWEVVYGRMRRWSQRGILDPMLAELRRHQARQSEPLGAVGPVVAMPDDKVREDGASAVDFRSLADEIRPVLFSVAHHLYKERRHFKMSQFEVASMMSVQRMSGTDISTLARHMEASAATMGVTVRRLVGLGWMTKTEARRHGDRRRVGLKLTALGARVLKEIRAGRSDHLVRQFNELAPGDVACLAAAVAPLKRLVALLDGAPAR